MATSIFFYSDSFLADTVSGRDGYKFAGFMNHKHGTTPLFRDFNGEYFQPTDINHVSSQIPASLEPIGVGRDAVIEDVKACFREPVEVREGFFSYPH